MTEEEAKTKPCIGPDPSNTGWRGNPEADGTIRFYCRGSACMAWRWESDADYEYRLTEWEDAGNIGGVQRGPEPIRGGFCGLAGKP